MSKDTPKKTIEIINKIRKKNYTYYDMIAAWNDGLNTTKTPENIDGHDFMTFIKKHCKKKIRRRSK